MLEPLGSLPLAVLSPQPVLCKCSRASQAPGRGRASKISFPLCQQGWAAEEHRTSGSRFRSRAGWANKCSSAQPRFLGCDLTSHSKCFLWHHEWWPGGVWFLSEHTRCTKLCSFLFEEARFWLPLWSIDAKNPNLCGLGMVQAWFPHAVSHKGKCQMFLGTVTPPWVFWSSVEKHPNALRAAFTGWHLGARDRWHSPYVCILVGLSSACMSLNVHSLENWNWGRAACPGHSVAKSFCYAWQQQLKDQSVLHFSLDCNAYGKDVNRLFQDQVSLVEEERTRSCPLVRPLISMAAES